MCRMAPCTVEDVLLEDAIVIKQARGYHVSTRPLAALCAAATSHQVGTSRERADASNVGT